jgi:hypothetical protein
VIDLILDFHRELNIVFFFFLSFCVVCHVNLLTTFRKPLWVLSSQVMSRNKNNQTSKQLVGLIPIHDQEYGTHSGFLNVVGKFTSHTVQKPQPPSPQKNKVMDGGCCCVVQLLPKAEALLIQAGLPYRLQSPRPII